MWDPDYESDPGNVPKLINNGPLSLSWNSNVTQMTHSSKRPLQRTALARRADVARSIPSYRDAHTALDRPPLLAAISRLCSCVSRTTRGLDIAAGTWPPRHSWRRTQRGFFISISLPLPLSIRAIFTSLSI